jgi:chromosome segregation ATPase
MNEIKDDMYKPLNEFKDNANKQLNEIRKTMQNMKEKFNEYVEILNKNHISILKMKSSMSKIKTSIKSLPNRLD